MQKVSCQEGEKQPRIVEQALERELGKIFYKNGHFYYKDGIFQRAKELLFKDVYDLVATAICRFKNSMVTHDEVKQAITEIKGRNLLDKELKKISFKNEAYYLVVDRRRKKIQLGEAYDFVAKTLREYSTPTVEHAKVMQVLNSLKTK